MTLLEYPAKSYSYSTDHVSTYRLQYQEIFTNYERKIDGDYTFSY